MNKDVKEFIRTLKENAEYELWPHIPPQQIVYKREKLYYEIIEEKLDRIIELLEKR